MSSGPLPFATYHRASQLGAGTYGSVVTVYNEDGEEFALKRFLNEDNDNDDDSSQPSPSPMDLGAMREISCLRLLRGNNAHPNITSLVDVQPHWQEDEEGSSDCLSMAVPLYRHGSLQDALDKGFFGASCPKRVKVLLAHELLGAVAFLHDNAIVHRDIKPDNIMLKPENDGWRPILIDFSLAKQVLGENDDEPVEHTGEVGTVTYTAPEVVARQAYGRKVDLWSVGVVLLEVLQGTALPARKDRQAAALIAAALEDLPADQPFPSLLRGLLQPCPHKRLSAREALQHPLFAKFDLQVPPVRIINVAEALPLEESEVENESPNNKRSKQRDRRLEKRTRAVERLCREIGAENPRTATAALEYCQTLSVLDDSIDDSASQSLVNCVILSYRFHEVKVLDLEELDEEETGTFAEWTLEDYVDDEATIFMIMDFCLYPRKA